MGTTTPVITLPPEPVNYSLIGKEARQSSTSHGCTADRAIDGNDDPTWSGKSCTHTRGGYYKQGNPWWQVDLEDTLTVKTVTITNRCDNVWKRLHDVQIGVTDLPGKIPTCHYSWCKPDLMQKWQGGKNMCTIEKEQNWGCGETRTITCRPGATGRYLTIQIDGDFREVLTMCEVSITV